MRKVLSRKLMFLLLIIFTVFFIAWTLFKLPMPSTVGSYTKIKRTRNVMNLSSNITHCNNTVEYLAKEMAPLEVIDQVAGVAINRDIPDTRSESCKTKVYSLEEDLKASIIITFHNEARSALLKTITRTSSVLNRSPPDLLEEIILIDDCSTFDIEADFLQNYHSKIKVFRNDKREGLMRSRNIGANFATGHFLVFLDSHCEVNVGWLEPLIYKAEEFNGVIVSPILDIIDWKSLQYRTGSTRLKGGFDWSLQFKWIPLSEEELEGRNYKDNLSYGSPAIPGGIFLINRKWFIQLGGFDSTLEIYGGESLELSLKTWMCGGQIEISVCSRVGHVFRRKHSFDFPNGIRNTILHNTKRIAESWLDHYKQFYYSLQPKAEQIDVDFRSLKKANRIKQSLQCRSMRWYLQNVFPELKIPNDQHLAFGELKNGQKCLEVNEFKYILLDQCLGGTKWSFQQSGILSMQTGDCLTYDKGELKLTFCQSSTDQMWLRKRGNLIHLSTGKCLENFSHSAVILSTCHRGAQSQIWNFSVEIEELTN